MVDANVAAAEEIHDIASVSEEVLLVPFDGTITPIVWMWWAQGFAKAPRTVQLCRAAWQRRIEKKAGWQLRF